MPLESALLGDAIQLYKECLNSPYFWTGIHTAHQDLKAKYHYSEASNKNLTQEIEALNPILYCDED